MKTSKKLLSLFLALVMVITSCSVGLTAFAADGNKTDTNLNYWNDGADAEAAFNALNELVGMIFGIDAVKNLLEENGIVSEVTEDTTLSDVVAGASPLLIGALRKSVSKEDFLTSLYGEDYTNNKEVYDTAFIPLDGDGDDEWSFYDLYTFCSANQEAGGSLGSYCKKTLKALDKLISKCESSMVDKVADSDARMSELWNQVLTMNGTEAGTAAEVKLFKEKITASVDFNTVTGEEAIREYLGKNKDYYYDYYKNIFDKLGMADEIGSLADLLFYHCHPMGKEILRGYIYLYLETEGKGNTVTAENIVAGDETALTTANVKTTVDSIYNQTAFESDFSTFLAYSRRQGNKTELYNSFKYLVILRNYYAPSSTLWSDTRDIKSSEKYSDLLAGLLSLAGLETEDDLAGASLDSYFKNNICNPVEEGGKIEPYDYSDYKMDDALGDNKDIALANALLNQTVGGIAGNEIVNQLIGGIVGGEIDLAPLLTNIWQNLYDAPMATLFNLLPTLLIIIDGILPLVLHDDVDDNNLINDLVGGLMGGSIDDIFLMPGGIGAIISAFVDGLDLSVLNLYHYTQAYGDTQVGLGAFHIDLNTALPSILHWITGDKNVSQYVSNYPGTLTVTRYVLDDAYNAVYETDEDGNPVLDENGDPIPKMETVDVTYNPYIPKFTNIYLVDQIVAASNTPYELIANIVNLINRDKEGAEPFALDQGVQEVINELFTFLRESVDDYFAKGYDKYSKHQSGFGGELCNGLNDITVALPLLIDSLGKHFIEKYSIDSDWAFAYEGKIADKDYQYKDGDGNVQTVTGKVNAHVQAFKDLAKSNDPTLILNQFVDLLIGNWINALTDLLNDLIEDENNAITYNIPLVQGLLSALGGFGETSIITDALNGLFQLKRSDAPSFTLEQRDTTNFVGFSNTSGFFLISNIRYKSGDGEYRGLIPFIQAIMANSDETETGYDLDNAFASVAPTLANSSKNKSAAGTDYSELLKKDNIDAAQKLIDVLDELLSSLLENTSLNGFDWDKTDNILSSVATFASAYFGSKNTNDIVKLINDYLYFIVGESKANPNKWNTIGNYPTKNGDVDKNRVYTSANLSNLVIQTYALVENIVDYLFYNDQSGFLKNRDPNMLIADALYGIISPDAVGIRLSDTYADTKEILAKKDYLNWNSFKVEITAAYDAGKQYNTTDYLKFGFAKGDKEAFYDALGESLSGVAAILGTILTKTYVDDGHTQNWYSNILYPVFTSIANAVGSDSVMSPADFNSAASGKQLVDGILAPVSSTLDQIYGAPVSFILNLIKGLAGVLDDTSIQMLLYSALAPINNHVSGLCGIVYNLSPTLAQSLGNTIEEALSGLLGSISGEGAQKDILVNLINNALGDTLGGLKLPSIDWKKLASAKSPAEVLLLVYGYVVDTLLGSDLLSGLLDSLDPQLTNILSNLSAAQILTVLREVIAVVQSPTEIYWTFSEYASKLTNNFVYPKGITAAKADLAVDKLDTLVENIFPLLNGLGVTDIEGLGALVNDKLYTNENITAIAKALYGALNSNSTVADVLGALTFDVTPAGVAALLTDKSYGKTFTSAASTLKKAKSWDSVKSVNWGFTNGAANAKDGFINGLAASLRPLNKLLAVFLCEGKLDLSKIDVVGIIQSLNISGKTTLGDDLEGYKHEYACDVTYTIKNGQAIITFRSYATQFNDNRTRQSVLEIDLVSIAKDLVKLLGDAKLDFGTNGYESAIIPILEAFMCDGVKTYKQYKADYAKAKDNLLIDILQPIGYLIDAVCDKPFDTLTAILPNVAYFIDSSGLEQAVGNLLAPITAKDGVLGVLSKNGLDIDVLISAITGGKTLGDLVAGLVGTDAKINLDLGNLKASNVHDIIIPLVSKLLKDKLGLTLPEFTWADLASHGTILTVASKALNDEGKYTTEQVQSRQGETLVAVLRYVADVLITNAQALKALVTGLDAIKNNATLKSIVESIFDQIAVAKPDDIVNAIFYLLVGEATDKFFDYRNFKYEESNFTFGDLDEDFCRQLAPMLDGLIKGLINDGEGLTALVNEKLYTDDLVAKLATGLYGAVEGVKINDSLGTLTDVLAMTGIDFTTSGVASLLTNDKYGRSYADAARTIKKAGSWKKVKADSLKFGVKDRDTFLHALTAVLRPIFGVLDVLLNDSALNLFDLISVPGSDGYTSTIVPLLEAFGVYNIKTQYQYREDIYKEYDSILLDILNPLWDKVEDILAAPIEIVADILPNLALFFANDGLIQIVENLLTPISELLDALRPIVDVNEVLKAAGLNVPKLLKDKVGLSVSKFDLYDLAGTLKPLVGAKNVVGTLNSILKVVKIGGNPIGIELPEINWLQLASRGEYVLNATSQAATYGGRIYVQADQDETLITVLRYLIETINYKDNYDIIVGLVGGLLDSSNDTIANVVDQVFALLKGDTDEVIKSLVDLLQSLAG